MKFPGPKSLAALIVVATSGLGIADEGRLLGFVADSRGLPVSGALISVVGKGIRGGLVTFTDPTGRVVIPSLPAGAYTLRALAEGERSAPLQKITVLPNQDSVFALSLRAALEDPDQREAVESGKHEEQSRRVRWLVRHKKRSILESETDTIPEDDAKDGARPAASLLNQALPWLPDMTGSVEWATPFAVGADPGTSDDPVTNVGAVHLKGRLGNTTTWSLGGLLAESDSRAWRMAAEFVVEPGGGHRLQAGAGYGDNLLRPLIGAPNSTGGSGGSTGSAFLADRIEKGPIQLGLGARYSYISFLANQNHLSPSAEISARLDAKTRVRVTYSMQTVTPGGDLLALSTLTVAPPVSEFSADSTLRAERVRRTELAATREAAGLELTGFGFSEGTTDPFDNRIVKRESRSQLRIANGAAGLSQGVGFRVGRRFGKVADASVTYTYGRHGERAASAANARRFHDVVARLETAIASTDTHLSALYRVNALRSAADPGSASAIANRFDVQLSQGLPFLGNLTRADWDLLVAFRNLLYAESEAAALDEVLVVRPPKRVVGGVSVRF